MNVRCLLIVLAESRTVDVVTHDIRNKVEAKTASNSNHVVEMRNRSLVIQKFEVQTSTPSDVWKHNFVLKIDAKSLAIVVVQDQLFEAVGCWRMRAVADDHIFHQKCNNYGDFRLSLLGNRLEPTVHETYQTQEAARARRLAILRDEDVLRRGQRKSEREALPTKQSTPHQQPHPASTPPLSPHITLLCPTRYESITL